jgi:signal transduction histidine kinase
MQLLTGPAILHLRALARAIAPRAATVSRQFDRLLRVEGLGLPERKALRAICPAATATIFLHPRPAPRFLEEVGYHGRRLARLNVPLDGAVAAVERFDGLLDPLLGDAFGPAREQLQLATLFALHNAFHEEREAEAQAFFGLARVEAESSGLDDVLRGYVQVLARVLRARAGAILLSPAAVAPPLRRPLYIAGRPRAERLIGAESLLERAESWWSYPVESAHGVVALIQLSFPKPYPWLPRERELLHAAAERCAGAIERARLAEALALREAEGRRAEEAERRRIGRELHDETGQALLVLRLQLELLERESPPELRQRLATLRAGVERNIVDLRRIIAALGPVVLERLGLVAALRQLVARSERLHPAKFRTRLHSSPALEGEAAEVIYRVAQESLNNIMRHSGATNVMVSLDAVDSKVRLRIVDNGGGFSAEVALRQAGSFGLAGMRERAALSGGTLRIGSTPGKGTSVLLEMPQCSAGTARNGKNSNRTG